MTGDINVTTGEYMAFMFIKITAPGLSVNDLNDRIGTNSSSAGGVINLMNAIQGGFASAQIDINISDIDTSIPAAADGGTSTSIDGL